MNTLTSYVKKGLHYLNLEPDLDDYDRIHQAIVKDTIFKGTNLWILIFAIVVASVGLNMNSTAVIIGAMLISPLMGPINGMGYSIATYDFALLRQSVKNFSFAVLASLAASTIYFILSPISTAHSELLARTSPTIYDVLIALFGGLAGIVAISSRQKGNVIPGVAIATALMPPLCTAGYGLATAQLSYFLGAIYLFTINTVFIGLSSVFVSQLLKFPIRSLVEEAQKKRVNRWISAIIMLVALPSIYFGYGLVQQERFSERASRFITNVQMFEGNYLLNSNVDPTRREITLIYGGVEITEAQKEAIRQKTADFGIEGSTVEIRQGLSLRDADLGQMTETIKLREKIFGLEKLISDKNKQIEKLGETDKLGADIFQELKQLYPETVSCAVSNAYEYNDAGKGQPANVIILKTRKPLNDIDESKIKKWLEKRLKSNRVLIYFN